MASDNLSICSLCGKAVSSSGEHQICCLACGHIYGYHCIMNFFETDCGCPNCRKRFSMKDIRLLFWGKATSDSNNKTERVEKMTAKLTDEVKALTTERDELKELLRVNREQLVREKPVVEQKRPENVHVESISAPSLIFERRITNGLRVCAVDETLVVSTGVSDSFGVEMFTTNALGQSSALALHSMRVTGMVRSDHGSVVTTSRDKSVTDVSIETLSVTTRHELDVGLLCCAHVNRKVVVVGGDRGKLAQIDLRDRTVAWLSSDSGPPIMSVAMVGDGIVMGMNPRESFLYDIRAGRRLPANADNNIGGGVAVAGTRGGNIFAVLADSEAHFYNVHDGRKFSKFAVTSTGDIGVIARPAVTSVNGVIYAAVPKNTRCGFGLHVMSKPANDIWESWGTQWFGRESPGFVTDLAIIPNARSTVLATVTSNAVTIYEIPIIH